MSAPPRSDRLLDQHKVDWRPHVTVEKLAKAVVTEPDQALALFQDPRFINTMSVTEGVRHVTDRADGLLSTLTQSPLAQNEADAHRANKRVSVMLARAALEGMNPDRTRTIVKGVLERFADATKLEAAHDILLPAVAEAMFDLLKLKVERPGRILETAADYMLGCHPLSSKRNLEFLAGANDKLYADLIGPISTQWVDGALPDTPLGQTISQLMTDAEGRADMLTRSVIILLLGMDQLLVLFIHAVHAALSAPGAQREAWFEPGYVEDHLDSIVTRCSGVRYLFRRALEDCELAGAPIRAGEFVCIDLANQPHDRVDYRPIAFGGGRHKCPGEKLTIAMLRATLPVVLSAFRTCHVEAVHWTYSVSTRCITRLDLRREPGKRAEMRGPFNPA